MKDCCRSFIFNYNIVFQLIIKISISEAFTKSCNVSLQTVQFVSKCPTNLSSYEAATRNKNCSSLSEEAQGCFPLQYHCVLSEDLEHAIEVCAPSLNIIDHVCAKFSTDLKSVMRVEGLNCSKCPYSYNSTLAYKYSECYSNLTQPLKTTLAQSTTQTNNGTDVTKDPDSYVDSTSGGNTADTVSLFVGVPLGIICLAALIFFLVKKCRNVAGQSQKNEGYASVPPSEPGGAEYHMQRDDDDEHAHISQFVADIAQLPSPYENNVTASLSEPGRAEYHMQRHDDDEHAHISQFVSDGGQQSGEHVLTSQSEASEIELTSPNVNTVVTRETVADIAQLPSPYENNVTASLPEPGGAEYHMQRDDDDEHAHISQFEAGEIESTIPNVNTVVTRETVADIAQLTSPYENNVTASLPVSTIEENQKLENLRAKLDSFKSSRQSKYLAYTKYNTRLLSFAKELPWSDDKRKQFSAYGFLYGGYDLKTICFHCGCNKDDWRETDDILETHLSLSEPCAYVQFVNVLLNSSQ